MSNDSIIYDFNTPNESFIKMHKYLVEKGINNNKFFLQVIDNRVIGLDPREEHITTNQKKLIYHECTCNFWYYLREVVRFDNRNYTSNLVPFELTPASLAASYHFINNIDFYLMQPRQNKSVHISLALLSWVYIFHSESSSMFFGSYKTRESNRNIYELGIIIQNIPQYIRTYASMFAVKFGMLNTPMTEDSAYNQARGINYPYQYISEFEFINHIDAFITASSMPYTNHINNSGHCRIFTSVAGDLNEESCQSAMRIIENTIPWNEQYYDMDINSYKTLILDQSNNGIVHIKYTYRELGLTDEWFESMSASLGNDKEIIARELLLERTPIK